MMVMWKMRNALTWMLWVPGLVWACAGADDPLDAGAPDVSDMGEPPPANPGGRNPGGEIPSDNHRPDLKRVGNREFPVGQQSEIQLEATDLDGDPLYFGLRTSTPPGAKFDKDAGKFTWTPEAAQADMTFLVTFEVSDRQLQDQETVAIKVVGAGQAVNRAPEFDEVGDQAVTAGQPFSLQLVATDPNGDPITYAMRGSPPPEAALDARSGLFTWTPDRTLIDQRFAVIFVASDEQLETEHAVTFVVVAQSDVGGQQNVPPTITPIEDQTVHVGQEVRIQVQAHDDNPAMLQYSVRLGPDGHQFDSVTGLFVWVPVAEHAGRTFRVSFQVTDGEFRAIELVELTVEAAIGTPGSGDDCVPDAAEPDLNSPTPIALGATIADHSICPAGDEDYYRFSLNAGQQFELLVEFAHEVGDLDVEITGPGGFVRDGSSTTDNELIRGRAEVAGDYLVLVSGFPDEIQSSYRITLTLRDEQSCQDDGAEGAAGNNDVNHAASLRDAIGVPLQLCSDNPDWYFVDLEAGSTVTIRALFQQEVGDLDMELLAPDGHLYTEESSSDNEVLTIEALPMGGRYHLQILGFEGAESPYRLELDVQAAPPCASDRVEPNDHLNSAEPTPPQLYTRLTACGEEDWYKVELVSGSTLNVFISYDAATAPVLEAFAREGERIEEQHFEVASGDGCQANRRGCRRLTLRARSDGWVYYGLTEAEFGTVYDLNVRVLAAGVCNRQNQTCSSNDVCDYQGQSCVDAFCDDETMPCPQGYVCYQVWCVEPCGEGLSCSRPDFTCKRLGDRDLCGLEIEGQGVGSVCADFSECAGDLDCLESAQNGYCTRACTGHDQCGAGATCAGYDTGDRCARTCAAPNDCAAGNQCANRNRFDDSGVDQVCEP